MPPTATRATLHQEHVLEAHIVERLVALQGYEERQPTDYDRPSALDRELGLRFVRTTQAKAWEAIEAHYPG